MLSRPVPCVVVTPQDADEALVFLHEAFPFRPLSAMLIIAAEAFSFEFVDGSGFFFDWFWGHIPK
jgi:hypothetical protein